MIPLIAMLVLMNRQRVVVDGQPTTKYDEDSDGQSYCSPNQEFVAEQIGAIKREIRELRAERVERDRLIANLASQQETTSREMAELRNLTDKQRQICDVQFSESVRREEFEFEELERGMMERDQLIGNLTSRLQEMSYRLEIVEGRQQMESCRWPASRGSPRLNSGRNTHCYKFIVALKCTSI